MKDKLNNLQQGLEMAKSHHLLGELFSYVQVIEKDVAFVQISSNGFIYANKSKNLYPSQWSAVLQVALLHIYLGKITSKMSQVDEIMALVECIAYWRSIGGNEAQLPEFLKLDREVTKDKLLVEGIPIDLKTFNLAKSSEGGALVEAEYRRYSNREYANLFAKQIKENFKKSFDVIARKNTADSPHVGEAKNWLLRFFPVVGVIAHRYKIVEDMKECADRKIRFAAIDGDNRIIYLNPLVYGHKKVEESIWLLSHLLLHIVMRHATRGLSKNKFVWNIACEVVLHQWLKEMQIGSRPERVEQLALDYNNGVVDDVYENITARPKDIKRFETLAGYDKCDIISAGFEADDTPLLKRGYEMQLNGRGTIAAQMEQEIKVLLQPSISWEVKLAQWMGTYIPQANSVRSYARPSRRQSAMPDTPTARNYKPWVERSNVTFTVLLDTSGSMMKELLGKSIGTIISYARERGVEEVRLVYCDAEAYDAGYVAIDSITNHLRITGGGGTVLQRGIDLIESLKDLPKEAPILILTDGYIDDLQVARPHAYVIPQNGSLPYETDSDVFYIKN